MSIRGKCCFCVRNGASTSPVCNLCLRNPARYDWEPTESAKIALRLEADLAAAREELAKHQPEERVGECFCGWCHCYGSGMWDHMVGVQLRENLPRHCAKFCGNCGAHLGADGIARRNADTALLNALQRLALESAQHGEAVEIDARAIERLGVIGLSAWPEGTVVGEEWVGPDLRAAIRAALDQEVPDE